MKITVRSSQIQLGSSVREWIEQRIRTSLERFADRVTRVTVHVIDLTGPDGGVDKSCRMEVRLCHQHDDLFMEGRNENLHLAVAQAAERTEKALGRALERSRDRKRRCRQPESTAHLQPEGASA